MIPRFQATCAIGLFGLLRQQHYPFRSSVKLVGVSAIACGCRVRQRRLPILEWNSYPGGRSGELLAPTPQGRWQEFLDLASGSGFWRKAERTYPALGPRIARVASDCAAAMGELATRFATDRDAQPAKPTDICVSADHRLRGRPDPLIGCRAAAGLVTVAGLMAVAALGVRHRIFWIGLAGSSPSSTP